SFSTSELRMYGRSEPRSVWSASRSGPAEASTSGSTPAIAFEPTLAEPARSARLPSAPRASRRVPRAASVAGSRGGGEWGRSRDMEVSGSAGSYAEINLRSQEIHPGKVVRALDTAVLLRIGAVGGVLAD